MRGLFALSGDPITYGHLNIIEKCLHHVEIKPSAFHPTFDRTPVTELVVWVGNSGSKSGSYLLEHAERLIHVKQQLDTFLKPELRKKVKVIGSDDLLADVALREGVDLIFRGVRNEEDRRYEEGQMAHHDRLLPGTEGMVRYLTPGREELLTVSSSLVKSLAHRFVDVSGMVPLRIKHRLEIKMHRQFLVGIAGKMATGKTWVSGELVKALKAYGIPAHHISIDQVIQDLYAEDTPGAQKIRDAIAKVFGGDALTADRKGVVASVIKEKAFGSPEPARTALHALIEPHIHRMVRAWRSGKNGVLLLEWALLFENNLEGLVNENVILVDSASRAAYVAKRGVDADTLGMFDARHWHLTKKLGKVSQGSAIVYQNDGPFEFEILKDWLFEAMPSLPAYWGKT